MNRSRQPLSEATAECRSRGLHHRPTPTPHYDESLEDEFLLRESLKKRKNAPPPTTPAPKRSSEARRTAPAPTAASMCSGVPPPPRLSPTTTSSKRFVDRKRSQPNSSEELQSASKKGTVVSEAPGENGGEESVESSSESSADVKFVEEHPEPSFHGSRVSVSSRDPSRVWANVKEESESVGGSGGDVPESDGGGEPPDRAGYVPRAMGTCIAGRTRTKAGTRDKISYGQYFDKYDTDDSEEEEEEEEETETVSQRRGIEEENEFDVDSEEEEEEEDETETVSQRRGIEEENEFDVDSEEEEEEEDETVSQRRGIEEDNEFDVKKKEYGAQILASLSSTEKAGSGRKSSSQSSKPARRIRFRPSLSSSESSSQSCKPAHGIHFRPRSSSSEKPAQRTHSRPSSSSSEKSNKLGTVGNPLCLDEDEDEDEDEPEPEPEPEAKPDSGLRSSDDKREEETESRPLKGDDLFKILTDTIWNDNKKIPEEFVKEKSPTNGRNDSQVEDWQILLPPIFSFGDEIQEQAQKTEDEKEIDQLWADFDFALDANNIGTYHNNDEDQTDEISEAEMKYDPSNSCSKGRHQFILDEQIGIRCKFCCFVKVHIKDIMPSWEASHFGERSTRKTTFNEYGPFIFNGLHSTGVHYCQGSFSSPRGTIWDLPGLDKSIFPHQREAVEFMWRNLAGSIHLDELKSGIESDGTGGCVISHAPGTGKTRTAITFIQTYMKVFPECRPVIFAPSVMLQGWKREIRKWGLDISVHNLSVPDYSGEEDDAVLKLVGKANQDIKFKRMVKLYSWDKGNSVILLTYSLFTAMTGHGDVEVDQKLKQLRKVLLEKPNLIIFDEGHIPRNDHSAVFKALKELKTSKRIILTGTPFQNNFKELYNILWLVRPKFAESKTSTLSRGSKAELLGGKGDCSFSERNEGKDKWATLTKNITDDRSITDDKTVEELKTIIEPFVHVYKGKVLDNLPGSTECVIVLDPVPLQHKNTIEKMQGVKSRAGIENDYRISLAAIHPSLVTFFSLSDAEKTIIDAQSLGKLRLNPDDGVKTKFVIELIRLSESLKERVLVFCHNLEPLDMLKDQLIKLFRWSEGKEVLRMVGKIPLKFRHASIDMFNDLSSEARVMLASTKACAEGISLVGASRVILLDVEWNPSVERQAISRAYRLGQTRFVYIYHLITYGTGEAEKYSKQNKKDQWSKLVFSPEIDFNNIKASSSRAEEEKTSKFIAEDKILEEMTGNEKLKDMFIKICYQPKESNIRHVFTTDDQNPTGT